MRAVIYFHFVLLRINLYGNGRYILLQLNSDVESTFNDEQASQKALQNRGPFFGHGKRVEVIPKTTCENDKIKRDRFVYIHKRKPEPLLPESEITWIATLQPSTSQAAIMTAERGKCNDLRTHPGYQKCGVGKELMITCLQDDDIIENGGYDLNQWDVINFNLRATVRDLCEAVVLVSCVPEVPTPTVVCRMYMQAALDSGYHLIFVEKSDDNRMLRFGIEAARLDFEQYPDEFIEDTGRNWFFCRCKPNRRQNC